MTDVPLDYADVLEYALLREMRTVLMQSGRLPDRLDLEAKMLHELRAQIDVKTLVRLAKMSSRDRVEFYMDLSDKVLPPR